MTVRSVTPSTEVGIDTEDDETAYRVVWHPEVHHRFNSKLYFYLIAVPRTHFDEAQIQIRSAFSDLRVHSFTMALVYGPNDVLVRCWLTPTQRGLLKSALAKERNWTFVELECDEIEYLWARRFGPKTAEEVAIYYTAIRQLSENREYFYRSENESMRELYEAGLLLPAPLRDTLSVKFYVWLTGLADATWVDAFQTLRTALTALESDRHITEATLHRVNDIEFFVKAVATEFADVYQAVSKLATAGKPYGLTSNTMLVAHLPDRETDQIDLSDDISPTLSVLCLLLGSSFKNVVAGAPSRVKSSLEALYDQHNDVFSRAPRNETVRACLKGIVRYASAGDTDYMNRHVAGFWAKFEYNLRSFLPAVLEECAPGANWIEEFDLAELLGRGSGATAGEAFGDLPAQAATPDVHSLSLEDVVRALTGVASNKRAENALDALLPERWQQSISSISGLRDAFSRGEIFGEAPPGSPLSRRWELWGGELLEAARVFLATEDYLRRRVGLAEQY